ADNSDHIKFEAAWALGNVGRNESLAAFGDLLASEDLKVRLRSVQALRALTGQKFKYSAYETADVRDEAMQQWRTWIAGEGKTARLAFPIRTGAELLGRTLICYYSQNKVVEIDADGKETWAKEIPYAWGCQGLPNGHRMVASFSQKFIAEYDADGREVWKKTGLPGAPFSVERLENGNVLVACSDSQKVVEVAPDESIAWQVQISGRPMDARRLDNGNTLVALQTVGKVVEVDRSGAVVWEAVNQAGVLSASRLENGNTLICRSGNNMVVEINRAGDVVWSHSGLRNPYDAQRLPSGNTLIVDFQGVRELNPKGEVVWQRDGNGASRVHRY
ncbi:MAG: PQQ-binding-like beta-propeller repeat protein, partial [Planctomycetales bacterium]|nr:PQQ-binding-like beta-propeller repeat protein [Planctomycetales bacterium]